MCAKPLQTSHGIKSFAIIVIFCEFDDVFNKLAKKLGFFHPYDGKTDLEEIIH